jgi:adenylate cyclase
MSFEAHLSREILQSERLRMAALAGVFGLLAVVFPVVAGIFHEEYERTFKSYATIGTLVGVALALVLYWLLVRELLARMLARGATPPVALRYLNALIETSVPSLLMLIVIRDVDPAVVLQGPPVLLYGVFIVLSTLRLEFALSLFTGAVAAGEYAGLSLSHAVGAGLVEARGFIFMKCLMLLLAGAAAGFVGMQLRRRIRRVLRATEERQRLLSAFGQQVSPQVAEELLRQGPEIASRRSFVCVMFMDIRNFTPLVEHRSPEEIVALQNEVFGAAVEIVNRHRGLINQFLGDGFMATFGAPIATGNECADALGAARELAARIERVQIGVGLHAGEAVTGNIGSAERKQYSITGNVVILASRIEQLNKEIGSSVLASREVVERGGAAAGDAALLGAFHVKGREAAIEIYRVA